MADPVSAALVAIPTLLNAVGSRKQAKAAEAGAEADAVQLRARAQIDRAMAQREALEERRQGRLALSSLMARAPTSDPGIATLAGNITSDSEYRALSAIYSGETGARSKEYGATQRRRSASDMSRASRLQQVGSLIGAGSQMYQNFGGGGSSDYSYNDDASGMNYSATGATVRARR